MCCDTFEWLLHITNSNVCSVILIHVQIYISSICLFLVRLRTHSAVRFVCERRGQASGVIATFCQQILHRVLVKQPLILHGVWLWVAVNVHRKVEMWETYTLQLPSILQIKLCLVKYSIHFSMVVWRKYYAMMWYIFYFNTPDHFLILEDEFLNFWFLLFLFTDVILKEE